MDRVELIEKTRSHGGFKSATLWLVRDGGLVQVEENRWYRLPWSSDFLYRSHFYFLNDGAENRRVIEKATRQYGYPPLTPFGFRSRASLLLRDIENQRKKRVRAEVGVLADSDIELKLILTPDGVRKEAVTIPVPGGGRKELASIHR